MTLLERKEIVLAALKGAMESAEPGSETSEQISPEHAADLRKRLMQRHGIPSALAEGVTGNTAAEIAASANRIRDGLAQYQPSGGLHTRPVSLLPSAGHVDSPPDDSAIDPMDLAKKILSRRFSEIMR
ncbi:hypothetical protein ABT093_01295 [Kitasatospora sp. NPDC002551]|uniref:hypothetical protein n=1 Tax=Kitasatospora sp. NPDC002551 TaxID=3154539 RepID=UPI00331ED561